MSLQEKIQPTLQQKLYFEQLSRIIKQCNDVSTLREIALELLKLNKSKTAVVNWATKRAFEADTSIKIKDK